MLADFPIRLSLINEVLKDTSLNTVQSVSMTVQTVNKRVIKSMGMHFSAGQFLDKWSMTC